MKIFCSITTLVFLLGASSIRAQVADRLVPLESSPDSCIRSVQALMGTTDIIVTTCAGRTYLDTNGYGQSWEELMHGDISAHCYFFNPGNSWSYKSMYLVASGGRLFRTDVNERVWTQGDPIDPIDTVRVDHLLRSSDYSATFYVSGRDNGVYRSTDTGQTWTAILSPVVAGSVHNLGPHMGFQDANLGLLVSADSGVFATTDGGVTWERYTPPDPDISVRGTHPSSWYSGNGFWAISADGRVFEVSASQHTWTSVDIPPLYHVLPMAASSLDNAFFATAQGTILSAGYAGLSPTIDPVRTDLNISSISHQRVGYLYVATTNAGLFRNTQRTSSVERPLLSAASPLSLESRSTADGIAISFSLVRPTDVWIEVYNPDGSLAYRSSIRAHDAGPQQSLIPGEILASGMYLIRMRAGSDVSFAKVLWVD